MMNTENSLVKKSIEFLEIIKGASGEIEKVAFGKEFSFSHDVLIIIIAVIAFTIVAGSETEVNVILVRLIWLFCKCFDILNLILRNDGPMD